MDKDKILMALRNASFEICRLREENRVLSAKVEMVTLLQSLVEISRKASLVHESKSVALDVVPAIERAIGEIIQGGKG
jgi:hypothetical protein